MDASTICLYNQIRGEREMAPKPKVTKDIELKIYDAIKADIPYPDISRRFNVSVKTIQRYARKQKDLGSLTTDKAKGRCDVAVQKPLSQKEIKRNVNEVLADALETKIFDAIRVYDPTAAKNDALPLAICMMADKMRLLRGESTSNISKQEVQIVALKLLDDEKRHKIVDNIIVDNSAEPEPA